MTGEKSYIPYARAELLDILQTISSRAEKAPIANSINTARLCRDILKLVFEITEVVFDALRVRSHTAARILSRSLIEYFVDLALLSTQDSDNLNQLFANYATLRKYWFVPKFRTGTYRDLEPQVVEQYRAYVTKKFPDIVENASERGDESKCWKEIDRRIRSTYQRHFSGFTFEQRVLKVVERRPESKVVMDNFVTAYALYSNYTHPSPYSVSQFHLIPGENWCPVPKADYQYFNYERELFGISKFAICLFSESLPNEHGRQLYQHFEDLVESSTTVSQVNRSLFQ